MSSMFLCILILLDDLSYMHLYSSPFTCTGIFTNSQYDQLSDGLIAQLVEHCTGIAEVMGLNPLQE